MKCTRLILACWIAMGITYLCGCPLRPPNIDALDPNIGPQRTLVNVQGGTLNSVAIWDAGTTNELQLPGAFGGATLFNVPVGAAIGVHQVQLKQGASRGNTMQFTVTAPVPVTAPRLDRVSILSADFPTITDVNPILLVQGANVDVDAQVLIDGVGVLTFAFRGMQNHLNGVAPQGLAFPIYHYLALIAAPGTKPLSTSIDVSIRNADGQTSNTIEYTLPASEELLDSDGDDIPDDWEVNGYDADGDGIVDIDLKALGADPLRHDIFVEVDVMQGLTNPPTITVWDAIVDAFANAPIINGETDGIHLVLDTSGSVAHYDIIDFVGTTTATTIVFNDMKALSFDDAIRGRIYHYCVWSDMRPNGSSGVSDVVWGSGGDDCIVAMDDFAAGYQTEQSWAETLMHELGHNLNQRHGGVDDTGHNPTYSSVMSYSWQLRTGRTALTRLANNIYAPFYYHIDGVVEVNGDVPPGAPGNVAIDYSAGMGRQLVENDLDETVGLYNGNAVYWNLDFDKTDVSAMRDFNLDLDTDDTFVDYANWANILYTGPRTNGSN